MHNIYIPYFVLYILIIHNNVIPPPLHTIALCGYLYRLLSLVSAYSYPLCHS